MVKKTSTEDEKVQIFRKMMGLLDFWVFFTEKVSLQIVEKQG